MGVGVMRIVAQNLAQLRLGPGELSHLPARVADHARRRWLRIEASRPWAEAFTTCWQRPTALPAVT
jgi:hypothetical protein